MALGWGIVGPGRISDTALAPAIAAAEGCFLQGVVSRDRGRAEAFAAKHGVARALTTYDELLTDPKVDVVYVGTPNAQHAEQVIAALQAGKHVLCDKPLATSVADAERMVEAARAAGRKLGTGYQNRHHTANREARRIIRSGEIGQLRLIQIDVGSDRVPQNWRAEPELAGAGALYNVGVHGNDLVRFLSGSEVIEISALNDCEPGEWLDLTDTMMFRLQNGVLAQVTGSHRAPSMLPGMRIYGSEGHVIGIGTARTFVDNELRVKVGDRETVQHFNSQDGFLRMVDAFNRAVIEDREPDASGFDGLQGVRIAEAVIRSAREGVRVRLDD